MRITILTVGSRGDVQPFIALGLGLQQAGHTVTLATHAKFKRWIVKQGLEFELIGADPQELIQTEAGQALLQSSNPIAFVQQFVKTVLPTLEQWMENSCNICCKTEAIVAGNLVFWSLDIAEKLGMPMFFAGLQPLTSTDEFPAFCTLQELSWLGRIYNKLTYSLMSQLFWQLFRKPLNNFRQSTLQLTQIPISNGFLKRFYEQKIPHLYGYSPSIIPKPIDWANWIHVTGYWFLPQPNNFSPPTDLIAFLDAGLPPVCISFGSMTGPALESTIEIALATLVKTGQRGILLTGWSGVNNTNLPDTVFKLESIPHEWLFPKMAAIVHHGGAGTTAAAFRSGVPAVIVPFFGDQPFWGYHAARLGVSPNPIPHRNLTVEQLTSAIKIAINNQDMQLSANMLSRKIKLENGVLQAVKILEQHLLAIQKKNF